MLLYMNYNPRVIGLRCISTGALLLGLAVVMGGCATMAGGLPGDISRSVSDAASASQSAALSFEQNLDERATDAVTGTTLDDMLDEVQTAATSVAELDTTTPGEAALREEATATIRECADSITAARESLSGAATGDDALERLQAAADEASRLSDELEKYR